MTQAAPDGNRPFQVAAGRPCINHVRLIYTLPTAITLDLLQALPGDPHIELLEFSAWSDQALDHVALDFDDGRILLTAALGGDRLDVRFRHAPGRADHVPRGTIAAFEQALTQALTPEA